MKINFSVIVTTYKSDYKKIFQTLKSIIIQKNIVFEIIITDDGTENFDVSLIKNWFKNNKFKNYKIIANKENKGTVINVYSGLENAKGEYVKFISPGDMLYDEDTLYNIYNCMNQNNYDVIFGKAIYYKLNGDNNITFINKSNPMNLKPYKNKNIKKIKKSYLLYHDYILGAALVYERKIILKYISKIINKIKYAEDCAVILMVADNVEIGFWDEYIIWYEANTGISTSGSTVWAERLRKDNKECFEIIASNHPNMKKIFYLQYGKYYKFHFLYKIIKKTRGKVLGFINKKNIKHASFQLKELSSLLEEGEKKNGSS